MSFMVAVYSFTVYCLCNLLLFMKNLLGERMIDNSCMTIALLGII